MKQFIRLTGDGTPDDPLSILIGAELESWADDVSEQLKDDIEAAAEAAESVLRTASPFRRGSGRGHYRIWQHHMTESDWHYSARVYDKYKPTLTHLLEYGHDIVRKGKVVGHAAAIPHIERGYRAAADYMKSRGWY